MSLHGGAVGLDANLLDATVAAEGGAGAAESRVLDAHAVGPGPRPRLLERGAKRAASDGAHRGARRHRPRHRPRHRAVGGQRRVVRDDRRHAPVGVRLGVGLAARVRHRHARPCTQTKHTRGLEGRTTHRPEGAPMCIIRVVCATRKTVRNHSFIYAKTQNSKTLPY